MNPPPTTDPTPAAEQTPRQPGRAARRGGPAALTAVCALLALVVGLLARPVPTRLPAESTGDTALAELAREVVGEDRPALAVAAVTPEGIRTAAVGARLDDRFEIGSISKGLTGLLLQDMIDRGEVTAGTRTGDLVDVRGPVADVTLGQLATHASGLPPNPASARRFAAGYWSVLSAGNPHAGSVPRLLADLGRADLDAPPATYSNAGFALLGAALAGAADTPYPQLLTERVLGPLGMHATAVPSSPAELGPADLSGETTGGRNADPWLGTAIAPAGGVRSDITDLAVLARALLAGTAPGAAALTPRASFDADRIGWAWLTSTTPDGRTVTWHNGVTGGFSAFLGLDRERGTAVVVLSAVADPPTRVTASGLALLDRLGGTA